MMRKMNIFNISEKKQTVLEHKIGKSVSTSSKPK